MIISGDVVEIVALPSHADLENAHILGRLGVVRATPNVPSDEVEGYAVELSDDGEVWMFSRLQIAPIGRVVADSALGSGDSIRVSRDGELPDE